MPFGMIHDIENKVITNPEAKDAKIRAVVGPDQGWDSHVFRIIEIEAGGHTPRHQHNWPHINYVLEGEGSIFVDGKEEKALPGAYAYIPANTLHQFKASDTKGLKFMCIVPKEGHY